MRTISLWYAGVLGIAGWSPQQMSGLAAFVFSSANQCWRTAARQVTHGATFAPARSSRQPISFQGLPGASSLRSRSGKSTASTPGGECRGALFVKPLYSVVEGRGERLKTGRDEERGGGMSAAPVVVGVPSPGTAKESGVPKESEEMNSNASASDQEEDSGGGGEGREVEEKTGSGENKDGESPDLSAELARLEELAGTIFQMAGREFKITSYVELSRVLFEDLKLPVVKQPSNKVLGGYYSTSNAVLNELSAMGYELPAKVLDYRALLYLIRSKQGKKKKKKGAGEGKGQGGASGEEASSEGGGRGERMSPEEKLMMSMLKEDSGVDALDRTMVRVGVDIEKVMERVQTMSTGGGLRTAGGATELKEESFVPEEGGFEETDLAAPIPMLMQAEEEEAENSEGGSPVSLYDKGWGAANNLVLVDAASILYRTYHAMPRLTGPDGTPVNAVLGFCNVVNKLLLPALARSRVRPYVLVVFDGHAPAYRQTALYPSYKANRAATPEDLVAQFPLAQEAAMAFGAINVTAPEGLEADDVIATFAQVAVEQVSDLKVTIVSSDKDFLQLVGEDITVFDPFNMVRLGPNEVFEKYGLEPAQLLDYFAMVGDAADNVPGIPGIGPKTAQELLEEFESFEELWEFKDEVESPRLRKIVEDNVEKFLLSRRLIRLKKLFEPPSMTMMPKARFSEQRLTDFCTRFGFKTLALRVKSTLARAEAAKDAEAVQDGNGGREGGGGHSFFS